MQNTAIFYVEISFKNSVISYTKNKGDKKPIMSNFIFYSIVFASFIIAIIFTVLYALDLKNDNFSKASGRLIVIFIMMFCMTIAFAILVLTNL